MLNIIARLLDRYGPMEFVEYRFRDIVDGKDVNLYRTFQGRFVLANHKWSSFRVDFPPEKD